MNGRMKKSNADKRKHPVSCRLTDQELIQIDSQRGGMTRGEFLRRAAMDAELPPPVPAVNKEAWQELSKLAGNFNQMQKQLNVYGALNNPHELPVIVQNLRLALLGIQEGIAPSTTQEEKLTTIQKRHLELRQEGCHPEEIKRQMESRLEQLINQIGCSESDFYGWDESVFYYFWSWCTWANEALEEVEKDRRRALDSVWEDDQYRWEREQELGLEDE